MSALPRSAKVLLAVLSLGSVLAMGAAFAVLRRAPPVPVYAEVPAFSLTDHAKQAVTLDTLRGRPWVADFIFTSCGSICPRMTAEMKRLEPQLPPGTQIVSFSVDPATDTPERLARYAAEHKAGPEWMFLTGDQQALFKLATDGFKLPAAVNPPEAARADGPFVHSPRFVLVDGQARIRGWYDSTDPAEMRRLLADARRIAAR